MARDYHRETAGDLTDLRTLLKHTENFVRMYKRFEPTDPEIMETLAMVRALEDNLQQYKRTGRIVCRNCGRVESSHRYGTNACRLDIKEGVYEPNG